MVATITKCKDCKNCKINWFEKLMSGYEHAKCKAYPDNTGNKAAMLTGTITIKYYSCSMARQFEEDNNDICSKFEGK